MTPHHRVVRNFVVGELPRYARPLPLEVIAQGTHVSRREVETILDDLEMNLFFLVRNTAREVAWAFPVTAGRTPHHLRFSTGERLWGA